MKIVKFEHYYPRRYRNTVYIRKDLRLADAGLAFCAGFGASIVFITFMVVVHLIQFRNF